MKEVTMAVVLMNQQNVQSFLDRIEKLQADAQPAFGEMTSTKMLAHLRRVAEVSLEEVETKDVSNFFFKYIMYPIAFHTPLPWPKGKSGMKVPEVFFPKDLEEFESEKEKCINALKRFVETSEKEPNRTGLSPLLGPRTLKTWQLIQGKHAEHHLSQFGV